jgi:Tfp pilus assembly protein FimV
LNAATRSPDGPRLGAHTYRALALVAAQALFITIVIVLLGTTLAALPQDDVPTPSATDQPPEPDTDQPRRLLVIARGDTLWDIAERHLAPGSSNAEINESWRKIWRLNRAVIGSNPDLIQPGQTLQLPDLSTGIDATKDLGDNRDAVVVSVALAVATITEPERGFS